MERTTVAWCPGVSCAATRPTLLLAGAPAGIVAYATISNGRARKAHDNLPSLPPEGSQCTHSRRGLLAVAATAMGNMVSNLVQAGNAYMNAVNLLLQRNNIKAGVQGVVSGGRVASGRVQKPAYGQDSKKPPGPPGGMPEQPAGGQKKRRKPRHKTKKQPDDQNPTDHQGGEQNGEGGDGGPPDHPMDGEDDGPAQPKEKE